MFTRHSRQRVFPAKSAHQNRGLEHRAQSPKAAVECGSEIAVEQKRVKSECAVAKSAASRLIVIVVLPSSALLRPGAVKPKCECKHIEAASDEESM